MRFVPYYRHQHKLSGDLESHVPCHVEVSNLLNAKQAAFAVKSNWELFRGWLVFKLFTYDSLVDNSFKVSTRTVNIVAALQNLE